MQNKLRLSRGRTRTFLQQGKVWATVVLVEAKTDGGKLVSYAHKYPLITVIR